MTNTPPTFAWYVADLVFQYLLSLGGLDEIATVNARKASKLYAAIDASEFYSNPVAVDCRSRMNVPFILADADLDKVFLQKSREAGLVNLKGHRSVGGMRASIYNAVPEAAVDALIEFMSEFERKNG
jgi:phosphoserine aminotransferase